MRRLLRMYGKSRMRSQRRYGGGIEIELALRDELEMLLDRLETDDTAFNLGQL